MIEWLAGYFVNPALAFGVGAVSLPVLIHLIWRHRARRVRWGAMVFLLEAYRRNRRRLRWEQWLLLLLRCAIVALLAMLVARPFVQRSLAAGLLGEAERTNRVILLDDSYSMSCRRGAAGDSVFSVATDAVMQISELVARESPRDALMLLRTSRPDELLAAMNTAGGDAVQALRSALEPLAVSQESADWPRVLDAAIGRIADAPGRADAVFYIVSDFRRPDWSASVEGDLTSQTWAIHVPDALRERLHVVLVDVGRTDADNLAIALIEGESRRVVAGIPTRFYCNVANHTDGVLEDIEIGVRVDDQVLTPNGSGRVPPGGSIRLPLDVVFPRIGSHVLTVSIKRGSAGVNSVALDDERSASVEVVEALNVFVVNGEPGDVTREDEVYLLKAALAPPGRVESGNNVVVFSPEAFESVDLADAAVVVLANVARLGDGATRRLETFVAAGGGLVVFCGDAMDAAFYNERLYAGGRGPLPARSGDVVRAAGRPEPFHIVDYDTGHESLRRWGNDLLRMLADVNVSAFRAIVPLDDSVEVAADDDAENALRSSASPQSALQIVCRFDDAARSPAILARAYDAGRCVLVTTTADRDWSNWPACITFVPMMLELVQYAAGPPAPRPDCIVGQPLAWKLDVGESLDSVRLRTPSYPVMEEQTLLAGERDGSSNSFLYHDTHNTGAYAVTWRDARGEERTSRAVVNPDARESDLKHADLAGVSKCFGGVGVTILSDPAGLEEAASSPNVELWRPLLAAMVVLLMLEQVLAWRFGCRGRGARSSG